MRRSPFFDGVTQTEVTIAGQAAKVPIFYYDGTATQAVFAARLGALRRLMPDPRFCPARLAPGLGAVAITCFEYRDTDIGPYNELAISVVLNEPWFLPNLPGMALISSLRRRQLHAWVHHLPVTTEIARAGGVDFYNYPKFVGGIDFEQSTTDRVCRLSEGEEHILTLSGKLIATPRSEQFQLFSHLWMDRQPQSSEFKINASEMGVSLSPAAATLQLGERHPIARELAEVIVRRRPLQYQYMPRFEGILYGPEHLSLSLLEPLVAQYAAQATADAAAQPA
ncbi:MAG: acetoacetate decarboxylase family protein [Solirubrobacteraceae bacterium]